MRRSLLWFAAIAAALLALDRLPYNWLAWAPEVCRLRNCYCEPFRTGFLVLQPLTAYSNLGYVLAGVLILGFRPKAGGEQATNPMRDQPAYAQAYGAAVLAAGLFSFFSHASLTRLGEWFDLMGVYAIAGFLLAYNLVRLAGLAGRGFAGLYAALLGALGVQMALAPQLQQIAVGLLIGAAVVLEAGVRLRRKPQAQDRWLAAAAACFILGGAFWLLNGRAPDCNPASGLPWHTGWHLLSAAAAGLLFRYYISEDLG